jgi:acylphosphatase
MATVHLYIKGKVQGVYYRATAKEMADKIGIKGWVKNTEKGWVELVASGTVKQLEVFTAWCHEGPQGAEVTEVVSEDFEETSFDSFSIVR